MPAKICICSYSLVIKTENWVHEEEEAVRAPASWIHTCQSNRTTFSSTRDEGNIFLQLFIIFTDKYTEKEEVGRGVGLCVSIS